jgi:hypothetical protein
VVLILGLIALVLGMTGHGIGGRRARRRRAAPSRRRGFPAGRPWRASSPRRRGTTSALARSRRGPPRRGSGRHRSLHNERTAISTDRTTSTLCTELFAALCAACAVGEAVAHRDHVPTLMVLPRRTNPLAQCGYMRDA